MTLDAECILGTDSMDPVSLPAGFPEIGLSREGRPIHGAAFGDGPLRISLIARAPADAPLGPRAQPELPTRGGADREVRDHSRERAVGVGADGVEHVPVTAGALRFDLDLGVGDGGAGGLVHHPPREGSVGVRQIIQGAVVHRAQLLGRGVGVARRDRQREPRDRRVANRLEHQRIRHRLHEVHEHIDTGDVRRRELAVGQAVGVRRLSVGRGHPGDAGVEAESAEAHLVPTPAVGLEGVAEGDQRRGEQAATPGPGGLQGHLDLEHRRAWAEDVVDLDLEAEVVAQSARAVTCRRDQGVLDEPVRRVVADDANDRGAAVAAVVDHRRGASAKAPQHRL